MTKSNVDDDLLTISFYFSKWRKDDILYLAEMILCSGGFVTVDQLDLLPLSLLKERFLIPCRSTPHEYKLSKTALKKITKKQLKKWISKKR